MQKILGFHHLKRIIIKTARNKSLCLCASFISENKTQNFFFRISNLFAPFRICIWTKRLTEMSVYSDFPYAFRYSCRMSSMSTSERDTITRIRVLSLVPAPYKYNRTHSWCRAANIENCQSGKTLQNISFVPSWPCGAFQQSRQVCSWCISLKELRKVQSITIYN